MTDERSAKAWEQYRDEVVQGLRNSAAEHARLYALHHSQEMQDALAARGTPTRAQQAAAESALADQIAKLELPDQFVTSPRCPACGSPRWVSVSLDGGWNRRAQCVPCGAYHKPIIGPGYLSRHFGDPEHDHPAYREPKGT